MAGWWYTYPSGKYVSWDYEIPNIWKNNPNVPNHQLDEYVLIAFFSIPSTEFLIAVDSLVVVSS